MLTPRPGNPSRALLTTGQPWSDIPFFSIGPSTTTGLLALAGTIPSRFCPAESSVVGTDTAGNTPALARVILDHFTAAAAGDEDGEDNRPLLYLTGDKNSSVLEETLAARSPPLPLEPLQVYATKPTAGFANSFDLLLTALPTDGSRPWIAIFSPSALPLILPVLRARPEGLGRWRFALIGPTTEQAWREQTTQDDGPLDWLVAPKPTAGALVNALRTKDGLL
jgi:uroporphyrinogen-III synthase